MRELEQSLGRTLLERAGRRLVLTPLLERHRDRIELDCVEGTAGGLLGQLAAHQLDAVLADQPMPPYLARSMRRRLLLKSSLSLVAAPQVREALNGDFPGCLDGAPLIARSAGSPLGTSIDAWLAERGLTPRVVARCDDSAFIKVFAQRGFGIACVPTVIESDVAMQFGLQPVGRVPPVRRHRRTSQILCEDAEIHHFFRRIN